MSQDKQTILQRFPTERNKQIFFPSRALFTLSMSLAFLALMATGILPIFWGIVCISWLAFDDLPITPIMQLFKSSSNLANNRKTLKSSIMIAMISLALIGGGLLAFFVLSSNPLFMLGIATFVWGTGCSPTLILGGSLLGAIGAKASGKVTPFFGMILGLCIAAAIGIFLPVAVPLLIDAVFITAIATAFIATIITKQCLRSYYKSQYGHSNADGYEMDRNADAQDEFVKQQAHHFGVSKENFTALTEHCKKKIEFIRRNTTLWDECTLNTHYHANAYKDIYLGLMNPHPTPNDVDQIRALLHDSQYKRTCYSKPQAYPFMFSHQRQADLNKRTEFHQRNIKETGYIDDDLITPFLEAIPPSAVPF